MSTNNESTPVAVLGAPKQNTALITFARGVHNALMENPSFPNPTPSLATFAANIDALDDAETKAATKAKGAAAFRDAKKKRVKEDLDHLCDYVQSVVEAAPNGTAAASQPSSVANPSFIAKTSPPPRRRAPGRSAW